MDISIDIESQEGINYGFVKDDSTGRELGTIEPRPYGSSNYVWNFMLWDGKQVYLTRDTLQQILDQTKKLNKEEKSEASLTFRSYVKDALRTDLSDSQYAEVRDRMTKETLQLLHATIGLATEAGELLDQLKKHLFYGRELDFTNLIEEGGDGAWYLALLLGTLKKAGRIPSSDVALTKNIAKLRQRYPEAFTNEAAIERDLDEERRILEE